LEMGEPVRIVELAEKLIRLSGREPYRDVQIVFTGLRPGEKLQEELMSSWELTIPTMIENIKVVRTSEADRGFIERSVGLLIARDGRAGTDRGAGREAHPALGP